MKIDRKTRLLYVTMVDVGHRDSGGSIVCRQHIERLANLPNLDLSICLLGSAEPLAGGKLFTEALGLPCQTIPLGYAYPATSSFFDPARRWPFSFEQIALASAKVDEEFEKLCDSLIPDVIVMDYLFTALFIPSAFKRDARRILITLNREADFFGQLRKLGRLPTDVSNSWLANWRLQLFENWAYAQTSVVALTPDDLPRKQDNRLDTVIRPVLDQQAPRWRYSGNNDLFFVGNIAHYPNFLAVRWLCEEFAPQLALRNISAKIRIIGAEPAVIPPNWLQPNVVFLGIGSKAQVLENLTTCSLFIAPIQNNYGSKIKILECMAHGTPPFGTKEAYSGLDNHDRLPLLTLDNPQEAAQRASELLSDRQQLLAISDHTNEIVDAMRRRGDSAWTELISNIMLKQPKQASPKWFALSSPPCRATAPLDIIDLISQDIVDATFHGLYPPERYKGRLLRWTDGQASIRLPVQTKFIPTSLMLDAWNIPKGAFLRLVVNDTELFAGESVKLPRRFKLQPLQDVHELHIQIESPPFVPPGETRSLGVALKAVALSR